MAARLYAVLGAARKRMNPSMFSLQCDPTQKCSDLEPRSSLIQVKSLRHFNFESVLYAGDGSSNEMSEPSQQIST